MARTTDQMCHFRWLSVLKGLLAVPNSHKPSGTFIHRCGAKKMWLCKLPPPLLLYFWLHVLFPIMFSTSFVFCRLLAVTTPRQLPPGLVSAVSSSTCGAPCLRACSPQLVEPGKKLLEEEKKTTLPEGVCKKVSRRGVDDQTFCWRGIEGALLRRMGTKPEKCISLWNFSCASLNCSNSALCVYQ